MLVRLLPPAPALVDYVEAYALLQNNTGEASPAERYPPAAHTAVVVNLNPDYEQTPHYVEGQPVPRYALFGTIDRFQRIQFGATVFAVVARLTPVGFYHLFGRSSVPYRNRIANLTDLIQTDELTQLTAGIDPDRAVETLVLRLDALLLRQLAQYGRPPGPVEQLIAAIQAQEQVPTVEQMADRVGLSRRHLDRLFTERVGVLPKLFLRLVRFERVTRQVKQLPPGSWQDILHRFGYYDESHFLKEFAMLMGQSPRTFLRTQRPIADLLYSL